VVGGEKDPICASWNDPQPLGIGFGKNQAGLLAAVNGALAAMRRDGRMNQLKEKWGVP